MLQRSGFPNISIKLYQDYNAWLENRFIELASTFITLTIRDALFNGINEGLLQIYDDKNLHTKLNGDEYIQLSVRTANTQTTFTRLYAIKHFSADVDQKGDNIIIFQLGTIHSIQNLKFSRAFSNNASTSVNEMLNYMYKDTPKLKPKVDEFNIRVPQTNWVYGITEYLKFIREHGMSVGQEQVPLVWEDITGLHFSDYKNMTDQEPMQFVVTEPKLVGELSNIAQVNVAFDFEWQTKSNRYTRNPYDNVSFYAHSFFDKAVTQTIIGEGTNAVMIPRSGAYLDQVYRTGQEEFNRMQVFAKYDGYAIAKTYGDFSITPGLKTTFYDKKNQFVTDFYVDEVIHEISREQSITNMYMFTYSKPVAKPK